MTSNESSARTSVDTLAKSKKNLPSKQRVKLCWHDDIVLLGSRILIDFPFADNGFMNLHLTAYFHTGKISKQMNLEL